MNTFKGMLDKIAKPSFEDEIIAPSDVPASTVEESESESAEAIDDAIEKSEEEPVETVAEPDTSEETTAEGTEAVPEDSIEGSESRKIRSEFWKQTGKLFSLTTDKALFKFIHAKSAELRELKSAASSNNGEQIQTVMRKYNTKRYTPQQTSKLMDRTLDILKVYPTILGECAGALNAVNVKKVDRRLAIDKCTKISTALETISTAVPVTGFESRTLSSGSFGITLPTNKNLRLGERKYQATDINDLIACYEAELKYANTYRKELLNVHGKLIGSGIMKTIGTAFKDVRLSKVGKDDKLMLLSSVKGTVSYLKDLHAIMSESILGNASANKYASAMFAYMEDQLEEIEEVIETVEDAETPETEVTTTETTTETSTEETTEGASAEEPTDDILETGTDEGGDASDKSDADDDTATEDEGDLEDAQVEVITAIEETVEEDGVTPSMVKLCAKLGYGELAKAYGISLPGFETGNVTIDDAFIKNFKAVIATSKRWAISNRSK